MYTIRPGGNYQAASESLPHARTGVAWPPGRSRDHDPHARSKTAAEVVSAARPIRRDRQRPDEPYLETTRRAARWLVTEQLTAMIGLTERHSMRVRLPVCGLQVIHGSV